MRTSKRDFRRISRTAVLLLTITTVAILGMSFLILPPTTWAHADQSPNGPGQPGAPGTTCGSPNTSQTPGNSASAPGSAYNPGGTAGNNYAGNPGTSSSANSQSGNAVSQYDIACFQNTQPHP